MVVSPNNLGCIKSPINKRDFDDKSLHNTQNVTVKDIDWKCYHCSYTINEYVSWSVFGDYDEGHEGAQLWVIR